LFGEQPESHGLFSGCLLYFLAISEEIEKVKKKEFRIWQFVYMET